MLGRQSAPDVPGRRNAGPAEVAAEVDWNRERKHGVWIDPVQKIHPEDVSRCPSGQGAGRGDQRGGVEDPLGGAGRVR